MIPGDVLHPGVDWRSASQHMEIGAHARRLTILVFTRKASVEHGVRKATLQQYVGFLLERHGIALATVTTTAANLSCVACLVLTLPTEWRMNRDFFVCCFQAKDDQALSQPHIYIYICRHVYFPLLNSCFLPSVVEKGEFTEGAVPSPPGTYLLSIFLKHFHHIYRA